MSGWKKKISASLLPLLLIVTSSVVLAGDELANAIQLYYDGSPDEAITAIRSLAEAGDAEAQYTLGSIFYSLSEANPHAEVEDFSVWYEMAAAQGYAAASTALGVVWHNRWLKTRQNEDAAEAISYYEQAIEQGDTKAEGYLAKLRRRGGFPVGAKLVTKPKVTPVPEVKKEPVAAPVEEPAPLVEEQTPPQPEVIPEATVEVAESSSADSADQATEQDSAATDSSATTTDSDIGSVRIDLGEVANQCGNYTETGFNYYGESIEGTLLVGKATIEFIAPPSAAKTQLVRFSQQNGGTEIFLSLHDVPVEVSSKLVENSKSALSGIVTRARMKGANCEIDLNYHLPE